MRQGRTFRRCTHCGGRIADRRCAKCGGDSFTWAYAVDTAPKGAPRMQKTKAGFATKAEAVEAIANLQTEKRDGTYVEPSKQTVAMYLEQWLAGAKGSSIRTSTWKSYEIIVRVHVLPELGHVLLQQLTRDQVRAMYAKVASGEGRAKPRSQKTVHNIHLALRKAFADAVDGGLLRANPAERAHRLSTDRPEMKTWSAAEVRLFLERSADDDNRALWRLALQTGMRRGELLGLRWQKDVALDASRLSVQQQLVRADDQVVFGPPKTKAGRRSISLDAGTVAALRAHKLRQSPLSASKHDLVFARADGRPHDPDVITQQFESATRRAGVKRIRLHDCRHTHATLLLEAGVHPKVVAERLGHSSVMVTLDRYSHVVPNMQADAAARIGLVVDGV